MNYYSMAVNSILQRDLKEWQDALIDTAQGELHTTLTRLMLGDVLPAKDVYQLAFYMSWVGEKNQD